MKSAKWIASFFILGLAACSSHPPATTGESPSTEARSTGTFQLRPYTAETWANGLQVITIESHALPSVSFGLLVKGGSSKDPMAKSGLMNLMAATMVRGTATRTADQIADGLGELGSEFEQDVSEDYGWFQVSGLSNHQGKIFDIFSDVILHPKFEKSELDREKKQVLAAIGERFDHPEQFAEEAFDAYLFGGHPYARPSYGATVDVKGVRQKDLVDYYNRMVRPNESVLVVTGDITPELKAMIKKTFESWAKKEDVVQTFPTVPEISGVNIRLVDKPDLTQSQIIIGHLGIKRNDPDYLALRVATLILGGDFSSRLMSQVRVKLGLTYGISSSFDPRLDRGPFAISTFTKNQTVGTTITESLKVYKTFYEEGVNKDEVESAKNFMMGNFPRVIETPERLGFNLALLRYYGVSDDYLKDFVKNVASLSASDINSAIKRHMNPNDLKILVLSKATEAVPQLKSLGLLEIKKFSDVF